MSATLYGIYGASGFGREVMPLARANLASRKSIGEKLLFVDDDPAYSSVSGCDVVSFSEFLRRDAALRKISLAIANSTVREKLAFELDKHSIEAWGLIAENVVIMDDVIMQVGIILSPFVTITSNISIGKYFQANLYSYVGHDCIIGDFVTFAPGVKCNGNVLIEDHAYIGTGAIIKQGRPGRPLIIGKSAIVGAGAVVTKNVPPGVTVVGNPAKVLSKENLRKS